MKSKVCTPSIGRKKLYSKLIKNLDLWAGSCASVLETSQPIRGLVSNCLMFPNDFCLLLTCTWSGPRYVFVYVTSTHAIYCSASELDPVVCARHIWGCNANKYQILYEIYITTKSDLFWAKQGGQCEIYAKAAAVTEKREEGKKFRAHNLDA